ncbi:DUF4231 domain-containing protein [Microvirga sp. BSC39]|uniref:DUF4231 domain-containing protein n=1 Tax=Microvirga sp. BSC39 TaxID=1549810 RepID=UPI0009DD4872|nr:DUF4231 domain-containing protein [Microvirga sp. BSC39]
MRLMRELDGQQAQGGTSVTGNMDAPASDSREEPPARSREARADQYFQRDLQDQRRWYSKHATQFKSRAQVLGIAVVAAGATTSFLQVFRDAFWVPVLTALLGAAVALIEGWRQIARYDETWAAYRVASERMKRERRLYVNGAGEYRGAKDEEEAFLRFVEAIETIIAEEQHIYWQSRSENSPSASRPPAAGSGADQGGPERKRE